MSTDTQTHDFYNIKVGELKADLNKLTEDYFRLWCCYEDLQRAVKSLLPLAEAQLEEWMEAICTGQREETPEFEEAKKALRVATKLALTLEGKKP